MSERFKEAKRRVDYNAHDLGEFGKMIRVEYVYDILADLAAPAPPTGTGSAFHDAVNEERL
jgi:hypothetical protein